MQKNRTVQRYLATIAALMILAGCTQTKFSGGPWTMNRTSVLQKVEVPSLSIGTNGTVTMQGYNNDGGQQITLQLLQALLNSLSPIKPVP